MNKGPGAGGRGGTGGTGGWASGRWNARRLARVAFWLYAAALVTATHWPRLTIPPVGIQRPDLLIHAAVFGLWTLLLIATGYLGPPLARSTIAKSFVIALVFAAVDEATQAIPGIHRHAVVDDFLANAAGVLLASLLALAASLIAPAPGRVPPATNAADNDTPAPHAPVGHRSGR